MSKYYGLPYQGSKNRLLKDLFNIFPAADTFIDLFGGGGSVACYAAKTGRYNKVIYNELQTWVYWAFRDALDGKFNGTYPWISHEEFNRVVASEYDPTDEQGRIYYAIARICYSFGTGGKRYAYGPKTEEFKRCMYEAIVNRNYVPLLDGYGIDASGIDSFSTVTERRTATRSMVFQVYVEAGLLVKKGSHYYYNDKNSDDHQALESMQEMPKNMTLDVIQDSLNFEKLESIPDDRLEPIERQDSLHFEKLESIPDDRLQSIERQESLLFGATSNITTYNLDYKDVPLTKNSIIYCDIPYKNTEKYIDTFDYDGFYDWCIRKTNEGYKIYVSEYAMPEDKFTCVWSKKVKRLFKHEKEKKVADAEEKLWVVKVGESHSP